MKISIQVLKLILGMSVVSYSGSNAASGIVKDARRYLNQLQAKAQDKALFAVLDRGSLEYKNSLLNSQYIAGNQDLYNRAKLTDGALSSSEWLLSKGIQENQNYHKQAGKETVLSAYESTLAAINKRRMSATWLKQQTENDQAQSQASRDEKAANQLSNTIAANYPNARSLFSQSEFLSPDNAYGKVATGAIAEGYGVIGLGKTAQSAIKTPQNSTHNPTNNFAVSVPNEISGKDRQARVGTTVNYGKQTANLSVSTGAENVALYPKLKAELEAKQKAGFEKVIKDLSVKPKDSVLMIPDYRQQLAEARANLPQKLQRRGNTAIANINIEGLDTKTMAGHSGVNEPIGRFIGEGKTQFKSLELPNKKGEPIDRKADSEYKILSNLADQLGSNTQAKGQVTIFTERPACPSCLGVAEQFNKRYPNIKVNIFDNNRRLINPNKGNK